MEQPKDEGFQVLNSSHSSRLPVKRLNCQCGVEYSEEEIIRLQEQIYCESCLEKQLETQKSDIQRLEEKYIFYKEYEGSISGAELALAKTHLLTPEEDQELKAQEKQLEEALAELRSKEKETLKEMENLKVKVLELDREESKYWEEMNKFEKKLYRLEQKTNTARWETKVAQQQYERLAGFSVINEVFKITCEGEVGLINGLALGKRPRVKDVDWQEVNAALGHLFLLFCFLVLKHQYTCVRMKQRECLGSFSRVKIGQKMYDIGYSKQKEKEFGEVMDQLLIEFQLFHLHLKETSPTQIDLPYKISIGEYKIESQFINPTRIKTVKWDTWSKSMKYFLTNFQYIAVNHSLADKFI